ncbi:MAG: acyloxyacyl hydrolase [Fimbriimonadales bacterium]
MFFLGNVYPALPTSSDLLTRLRANVFELSIGHGAKILGTSEIRYGVGVGVEWGRPGRILKSGQSIAIREEAHLQVFRSFNENEGFDGLVAGVGIRLHPLKGAVRNGYVEIGTGAAITDGVSTDVNSHFNFVSFVGAGFYFDSAASAHRFGIRWIHVSNANIEPPNIGLNQFEAVFGFRF